LGRYDEAASWAAMALQDNPDLHMDYASLPQAMQWPGGWGKQGDSVAHRFGGT
jgi:hypothetical protein